MECEMAKAVVGGAFVVSMLGFGGMTLWNFSLRDRIDELEKDKPNDTTANSGDPKDSAVPTPVGDAESKRNQSANEEHRSNAVRRE